MKYLGALFDMDGVVVDNHAHHFAAWMEFSRRHRFPLDAQIYRDRFNGKTNADLFRMVFGEISAAQAAAYADEKEGLYRESYRVVMEPLRGLRDYLSFLHDKGVKVALGTSAPTVNVDFVLDGLGLRDLFPVVVDGSMVSQGKPAPDIYLACARGLGLPPESCGVFEDSLAGLAAGKAAGCGVVGIATSHPAHELTPHAPMVVSDFCDDALRGIF